MLCPLALLQFVNIDLDIVGDGMARGKVLVFNHHTALRAVKFQKPAIVLIRAETVNRAVHHRRMHLFQGFFRHKAALFIVLAGIYQNPATTLTKPVSFFRSISRDSVIRIFMSKYLL